MSAPQVEHRSTQAAGAVTLETRADGGKQFAGYAATFYDASDPGTEYQLYSDLRERVMPTAFDRALREKQDCRGTFNHDPNYLLGRCSAGTMRLSTDRKGLRYEIDYNDADPDHQKVRAKIERGDVTGSSFGFVVRGKGGQLFRDMEDGDGDNDSASQTVRELHDVDLVDGGPVTFPAYTSSTASVRSAGEDPCVRAALEAWREGRAQQRARDWRPSLDLLRRRQRVAEIDAGGSEAK